ncbi:hypothetical protein RFI_05211 [Reticulomyxa filosa]|uniref:Peptidase C14 caspase domain-containing protein n=1 Tax=Reticulomyxa filosa TaxID=46433 RepID=X6P1B7_RETFI|nr:hypothetical protein RFI_05211 [Reticulomyxa filosa]|eukprot:ETO31908.1 hypothetical protein RFI_05211 [Reticulomyxa filosa]
MSSSEVFVTIGSKQYRLLLTSLTIEHLKQQIMRVVEENKQRDVLQQINISNNSLSVINATSPPIYNQVHLCVILWLVYFALLCIFGKIEPFPKEESQKKALLSYEIKNPLVLLMGSIKYKQVPYLEVAKQDINLLQSLFEKTFGYQIFATYDSQNKDTESLNLDELDQFIFRHASKLCDGSNKRRYDGLIVIWCGHGSIADDHNHSILTTSDEKEKYLKDIQNEFVTKTDYFVEKPKLFMQITYKKEEDGNKIWFSNDIDIFTVFANTSQRSNLSTKNGSHFTESLFQSMETNVSKSLLLIIKEVTKVIDPKSEGEVIQYTPNSMCPDVHLIPTPPHSDDIKNERLEATNNMRHWGRNWRKATVKAAKMVERMLSNNEQGVVIVVADNNVSKGKGTSNAHLTKLNNNFSFDNNKVDKRLFDGYWIYAIKKQLIILNDLNIDGNVYAVDCEIRCKENVDITTQLFVTKNAIVDEQLTRSILPIPWNTKIYHDIPLQLQDLEEKEEECSAKKLFENSIIYLQKYLQISIDMFGMNHYYAAIAYNMIGIVHYYNRQFEKATEFYEKALRIALNVFGANHVFIAQLYHNLALLYKNTSDNKVIGYQESELRIRLTIFGPNHFYLYSEGIDCFQKALDIRLALFSDNHVDISDTYYNLGIIYKDSEQYEKSIECYEKALKIQINIFGNKNRDIGDTCWNLGIVFEEKGENQIACKYYEKAWNIYSILLGEWDEETVQARIKVVVMSE